MPVYGYRARDPQGRHIVGKIGAVDLNDARAKLVAQQLRVDWLYRSAPTGRIRASRISKSRATKGPRHAPTLRYRGKRRIVANPSEPQLPAFQQLSWLAAFLPGRPRRLRVPARDLTLFTQQVVTMLNAGISLSSSLDFCARAQTGRMAEVARGLTVKLSSGSTLAFAMADYPGVFSPSFVGMVRAGENSGQLARILGRLGDRQERELRFSQGLWSSATYLGVLILACIASCTVFLEFVLPAFAPLYRAMGLPLPAPTRLLLWVTQFLRDPAELILSLIVVGGCAWWVARYLSRRLDTDPKFAMALDRLPLRLPVIGPLLEKVIAARLLFAMGTMLDVGVSLSQSLLTIADMANNLAVTQRLKDAHQTIANGESLGTALERNRAFPKLALVMISEAADYGSMATQLQRTARVLDEEAEFSATQIMTLLEPIMMALIGAISCFLILATIYPVIGLIEQLS